MQGCALPHPPRWRVGSWEGVGARRRRAPTPKPFRGRAMFTSEAGTPCAFVYSFLIRWPISPRRRRKPIPEQVKPVAGLRPPTPSPRAGWFLGGLRPPTPSPRAGWFLGGGRGAAAPRPYPPTLPRAGYVHLRHPCGCAAQRRDDHGASLGGPPPPWPSPAGGGNRAPPRREGFGSTGSPQVGKPGFPVCSPQPLAST